MADLYTEVHSAITQADDYMAYISVIFTFYLTDADKEWYFHLISNKQRLKKQIQIGILYNTAQCKVSIKLQNLQKRIRTLCNLLYTHKSDMLYVLNFIAEHASVRQRDVMIRLFLRKTYANTAKDLNISVSSVQKHVQQFWYKAQKHTKKSTYTKFVNKSTLVNLPIYHIKK